ncbi:TRAP transporter small permease [Microvirga splendida]|uniref:TRAP transporter small permease protein n=1 Tax=Microvirga splendida TaxID=2795727 RepID=A0ABS0XVU9_9HYPH|nr:TRAP transporter small permease [Microvirga splendida]MBJ6123860.1 TRAP transporter small permease [Microvirga splendida]
MPAMQNPQAPAIVDERSASAPPEDVHREVDELFEQWQEEESHVDLSDLRWSDVVVFAIFWILFGIVFLQFFTRYVLNDSLGWTEEIARYFLILITFVGSVTAMRKGSHIAVEALLIYLPRGARHWTLVAVDGLVALFCGAMAWYAYQLGALAPGYMVSIDIPKSYIYWAVSAALIGVTVHATLRFLRRLRHREADAPHGMALD